MRILVTGGSGVLGRATLPHLAAAGHEVAAPARDALDLLDPKEVGRALEDVDAVLHLASRIPPVAAMREPGAWDENDLLRADATRVLVDAALAAGVARVVVPTVTFVYPRGGAADEDTDPADVAPALRSALAAEAEVARFARAGRTGVVLRLGLLDGPGTRNKRPDPAYGATVHVDDAGRALAAALDVPSGVYNVCRDGERVRNARFTEISGWRPQA